MINTLTKLNKNRTNTTIYKKLPTAITIIMQNCNSISILVVEDMESIRELIREILEEDGHDVEVACDGKEGLELFKKKHFDIVFTDFKMPEMSGCEMAEKIKMIKKDTVIVLVTAWAMDYTDAELRNKGIDFIVKKPFRDEELQRIVRKMGFKEINEPMSIPA